jgi:hypothetical protein
VSINRVPVRIGELVCLSRPNEAAACQALMEEISRSPVGEPGWKPKWKWSERSNKTATFYAAGAAVFPNRVWRTGSENFSHSAPNQDAIWS